MVHTEKGGREGREGRREGRKEGGGTRRTVVGYLRGPHSKTGSFVSLGELVYFWKLSAPGRIIQQSRQRELSQLRERLPRRGVERARALFEIGCCLH